MEYVGYTDSINRLAVRNPLAWFVTMAFAISWSIWAPLIVPVDLPGSVPWLLYYAGVIGPAAAAFLLAGARDAVTRQALRHRLLRWRVRFRWYAIAMLLPLASHGLALVAALLVSGDNSWQPVLRPPSAIVRVVLLLILLVPFEEIGWRGYALPVLQHRYTPLTSSVIVAFIWALWHLPLAWAVVGYQQTDRPWAYMLRFTISIVPISCLATWLFNRTGESVPIVSLFHIAVNVADYVVVSPEGIGEAVLWSTTLLNVAFAGVAWRYDRTMGRDGRGGA